MDKLMTDKLELLTRRYGADVEAITAVLCPLLLELDSLIPEKVNDQGQPEQIKFTIKITKENYVVLTKGRTGKFVPLSYFEGKTEWKEIAKGRIIDVNYQTGIAIGEVYQGFGGDNEIELSEVLKELNECDFLEIDQYGAAAKVLSGLAEYYLVKALEGEGFEVVRMPEDMASHLGSYANFDFLVRKNGVEKRIEVKSLWGTNTDYARLIHSTTTRPSGNIDDWTDAQKANYYQTSSCKFATQDFFAVSLFLRTGCIKDFAFSRSVQKTEHTPYGLSATRKYPEHVNQNPSCRVGDGSWFSSITEVWDLP